jgi:hypothetical protein
VNGLEQGIFTAADGLEGYKTDTPEGRRYLVVR